MKQTKTPISGGYFRVWKATTRGSGRIVVFQVADSAKSIQDVPRCCRLRLLDCTHRQHRLYPDRGKILETDHRDSHTTRRSFGKNCQSHLGILPETNTQGAFFNEFNFESLGWLIVQFFGLLRANYPINDKQNNKKSDDLDGLWRFFHFFLRANLLVVF